MGEILKFILFGFIIRSVKRKLISFLIIFQQNYWFLKPMPVFTKAIFAKSEVALMQLCHKKNFKSFQDIFCLLRPE